MLFWLSGDDNYLSRLSDDQGVLALLQDVRCIKTDTAGFYLYWPIQKSDAPNSPAWCGTILSYTVSIKWVARICQTDENLIIYFKWPMWPNQLLKVMTLDIF